MEFLVGSNGAKPGSKGTPMLAPEEANSVLQYLEQLPPIWLLAQHKPLLHNASDWALQVILKL